MAASTRRVAVNTAGFETPALDHGPVKPNQVERNEYNPRLVDPPPAGAYALRPVEAFKLSADPHAPRAVIEADLPELFEWGLPHFAQHYPGVTIESMMPLIGRAIQGFPYRALRTANSFAVFMCDQKLWMAKPVVFDLFVCWREPENIHEAVQICRHARHWARSIGASEFQLIECFGSLGALAERLGFKEVSVTRSYGCKL